MPVIGRAVATVVVVAALTGCATAGGEERPDVRAQLRATFSPQDVADYERAYDERLARCVRAAGFAYTPFHPRSARDRLGLSEAEFAERHGFGIATLIDSPATAPQVDPNAAVRAALPERERARYDGTLKGCADEAARVLGPPPNAVLAANDDEYLDVARRAEADPRIAQARRAYAACVAARGITGDSGEAVRTDVRRRATPFLDAFREERGRWVERGRDITRLRVGDALRPDQLVALDELRRYELRAAAADRACGARLYPVVDEVHAEYTRRYLDGQ